jgi:hypothetical protein
MGYKSDHPVLNSRYLIFEAQQAHYYGLPPHLALASVTSAPAAAAGLAHRLGVLRDGADADVVLWDSHPLHLGATPLKVWIDGIQQIPSLAKAADHEEYTSLTRIKEGPEWGNAPKVPNWDEERAKAVRWEGLPPLEGQQESGKVVFRNVKDVWTRGTDGMIEESFYADSNPEEGGTELATVVIEKGRIVCAGPTCSASDMNTIVDLHGGSISPGFMSFGSPLGLEDIAAERSTGDGPIHDAFVTDMPSILGDSGGVVRAIDALKFQTRNALSVFSVTFCSVAINCILCRVAYRAGVTLATSFPVSYGSTRVISGLSTTFRTGSKHGLEHGSLIQEVAALHVEMGRANPVSVSEQIAGLRRLLFGWENKDTETVRRSIDANICRINCSTPTRDIGSRKPVRYVIGIKCPSSLTSSTLTGSCPIGDRSRQR